LPTAVIFHLLTTVSVSAPMYYLITNTSLPPGACDFTAFTLLATFWTRTHPLCRIRTSP
jgi:hypothetical protein